MIHFVGTVLGDVQLERALTRIVSASKNFTEPFELVGEDVRKFTNERFDNEGYGDWPPLAPSTIARKIRLYGNPKTILKASESLVDSLTIKGAAGNVTRIFPTLAEFGTSIFYAIFHQTGTSRMPAREIFLLREEEKRQVVRTIQRYLIASGQSAGFTIFAG